MPFFRRALCAGRLAALRASLCALGAGAVFAACSDSTGPGPVVIPPSGVQVGDAFTINAQTNSACGNASNRGGKVVAISDRAIVVADTANPVGGFTTTEYQSIAAAFDTLIYPVDVRHFGAPLDIDNNGRVIIFYTRAVNELTPASVQYVIGGFFISRDLFPKTSNAQFEGCAGSNQGELFYLLVPDPNGTINGNPRAKDRVLTTSLSTVAHEFQHLINAERRLYVLQTADYYEDVWLNEGLSHVAEELNFYRVAGLSPAGQPGQSPRANLGTAAFQAATPLAALNGYQINNLSRLSSYLKAVADSTPIGLKLDDNGDPDDDGLATRGAAWGFLRYAADRLAGTDSSFFYNLVNTRALGVANLRTATGAGAALGDWFRDWAVANYADDYATPALDARFQLKSWNFRSILPALSSNNRAYPLDTRALSNGVPVTGSVVGATAAYFPFTVAAGATATVRTRGPNDAAPGAAVRLSLVRVTTPDVAGGPAVTTYEAGEGADLAVINPSAAAAQYALVAFNNNLDDPQVAQELTVTATGISAPAAASVALRSVQPGPTVARLEEASAAAPMVTDLPLQVRFRDLNARELTGRVAGAQAWYRARRSLR